MTSGQVQTTLTDACIRIDLLENAILSNVLKLVGWLNRDDLCILPIWTCCTSRRVTGREASESAISRGPAEGQRKISRSGTRAGAPNEEKAHVARVTPLRFHDA